MIAILRRRHRCSPPLLRPSSVGSVRACRVPACSCLAPGLGLAVQTTEKRPGLVEVGVNACTDEPRHDLCFERKRPCFGSKTGVNQVLGQICQSQTGRVREWANRPHQRLILFVHVHASLQEILHHLWGAPTDGAEKGRRQIRKP